MKLIMATLLNFNVDNRLTPFNNIHTSLHNDPGYKDLINQQRLLSKLLILTHEEHKWQYYQKKYKHSILRTHLSFKNLHFRYKYSKWIYDNYSNSMANHIMVQKNEASALLQWANRFNRYYTYLKIIKIIPRINENQFQANLLLIPFSTNKNISFSLKDALLKEYHTTYNRAFYQFENDVGYILANIMHKVFTRCIPDVNLHFINNISNYRKTILKLKPYYEGSHGNKKHSNHISTKININDKLLGKRLSFHPHPLLGNSLKKYNTSKSANSYHSNLNQKPFPTNTHEPKYASNYKRKLLENKIHHESSNLTYSKSSNSTSDISKESSQSVSHPASSTSSYNNPQVPSRMGIRHKKASISDISKSNSLKVIHLTLIIIISFLVGVLFVILFQLFRL